MKKRYWIIAAVFVFLLCLLFPYSNRTFIQSKLLLFKESKHERTEEVSAIFSTKAVKIGAISLEFENSEYERKNIKELASLVQKDMSNIKSALGSVRKARIYVVPSTFKNLGTEEGSIFVKEKEICSGEYLISYVNHILKKNGYWKGYSFSKILRGDTNKKVKVSDNNYECLTLFPEYLDKRCDDNYRTNRKIIVNYAKWLVDKYGYSEFLDDSGSRTNEYLSSLNQKKKLKIDNVSKEIAGYNLEDKDGFVIYDEQFRFSKYKEYKYNPRKDYKILYEFLSGKNKLKNYLGKISPTLKKELKSFARIRIMDKPTVGLGLCTTNIGGKEIHLEEWADLNVRLHELTHAYAGKESHPIWFGEGLAEYCSLQITRNDKLNNYYFARLENNEMEGAEKEFYLEVLKLYNKKNYKKKFDAFIWNQCIGAVSLQRKDLKNKLQEYLGINDYSMRSAYETDIGSKPLKKIDSLSYFESSLLIEYLVNNKDLKKFDEILCHDKGLSEAYRESENDIFNEFMNWVRAEYKITD